MAESTIPITAAASAAVVAAFDPTSTYGALGPGPLLILGSVVGACFSIGVGRAKIPVERRFFLKFSVSMACGLLFTPLVFRWFGWSWDPAYIGPVACITSALAVSLLHKFLPMIETRIADRYTLKESTNVSRDSHLASKPGPLGER